MYLPQSSLPDDALVQLVTELKSNGVRADFHQLLTKLPSANLQTVADQLLPEQLSDGLGTLVRQVLPLVTIETIESQLPPELTSSVFWTAVRQLHQSVLIGTLESQHVSELLSIAFGTLVRLLPQELRSASLWTILDHLRPGGPGTPGDQLPPELLSGGFEILFRQLLSSGQGREFFYQLLSEQDSPAFLAVDSSGSGYGPAR